MERCEGNGLRVCREWRGYIPGWLRFAFHLDRSFRVTKATPMGTKQAATPMRKAEKLSPLIRL